MTTSTAEVKLPNTSAAKVQKDYEKSVAQTKPLSGYVRENYWASPQPLLGARIAEAQKTIAEGATTRTPLIGNRLRWAARTIREARHKG